MQQHSWLLLAVAAVIKALVDVGLIYVIARWAK
jgi:hypothetical protein